MNVASAAGGPVRSAETAAVALGHPIQVPAALSSTNTPVCPKPTDSGSDVEPFSSP